MSGLSISRSEGDGFSISSCSLRTMWRNDYSSFRLISRASILSLVFYIYFIAYYWTISLSFYATWPSEESRRIILVLLPTLIDFIKVLGSSLGFSGSGSFSKGERGTRRI